MSFRVFRERAGKATRIVATVALLINVLALTAALLILVLVLAGKA